MADAFDISVVVPTYNRGRQLEPLLLSLLTQDAKDLHYEIVVVDNNSNDDTRRIVETLARTDPHGRLRYVLEPRQGVSYARNTGVAHTTAPIVAFLDDDGVPGPDWVVSMKRAFDEHPDVDCIGGRITAKWVHPRPSWLTAPHWGPIAVQDRPRPAFVNKQHASACLLSANLGCRREAFNAVGGFSPEYPRNQDREFEMRLWRAGRQGLYLPAMDVTVEIPPERLTRRYHRKWQATTGKYHALMRYRDTLTADGGLIEEPADRPKFLGSPRFLYREFLAHLAGYLRAAARFDADTRFFHETRLWYFVSFFWTRWKTRTAALSAAAARPQAAGSSGR
jgi:glucosyl-dolichyl phosphate glucuronosyltransferase